MKKLGLFIVILLISFNVCAMANELGIKVTGTVTSSTIGSVAVGDSMVGYCSYDLDADDQNPSTYKGEYELLYMEMQIGDWLFYSIEESAVRPMLEVWMTDEYYKASSSACKAKYNDTLISGGYVPVTLFNLGNFSISRENDLIPVSMPDIGFFTDRNLFSAATGISDSSCSGVITSIEVIPEPCTVLLFGVGGMVVVRRRRRVGFEI